ncbi:hypothetical protein [Tepidimicrobium xylanilyticum]|uniref:hypothetical protein n=1 Tax=Tepidimicrobium xylanilyticum TaxID=1123352 RepID=UPI002655F251|nr:hypothetical protein [Tepidimicrobium xylanilyticum]GMG96861.1 hypothetical protein EN5CB1_16870 [Tepidimicrobium xylanilyticum]
MYPVSELYKQKIKENNRIFECKIQIEHSQGTLEIDDKDLVHGSLTYTEASQAGEEFTIGGTVASDISFTILNKPEYENIVFMGATVFVNIGLQIQEGIDAHFLQPSQPSKMKGYEEKWEYVPLGRFNIDYVNRQRNTIQLKAIDNMINLDKSYSLSKLSYPATLYQIYVNICNVADIPVGTTNFPNKDYVVKIRPDDDLTLRDVLGYVAELAGCFAKCNRHGALELRWYEPTDITLGPANRFNFKPSDDVIQIKGVMATIDGTTYLAGSDEYAIDLSENPLLQGDYETVLPNIYNNVKDTVFTPYTSDWQGNPAIQAGDMIKQIDRDGKEYQTIVTKSIYKYRGKSILEAKGLPEISRGYKGSTNRKIAEIKRKIDVEIGDKLTTLEEQQLQATELIANMLGGYAIKTEDAFYIADNEDLSEAKKVWKWGIGGFGYSENGVDGPYTTAVTADGSIVAELVSAGIITADMIQAGILQSQDGSLSLNLNNGAFSFNHNIVKFTDSGLRVMHSLSDEYSEINYNGFVRKWKHGTAQYLNDIYVIKNLASDNTYTSPRRIRIDLPTRFIGRNNIKIILALNDFTTFTLDLYERSLSRLELVLNVDEQVITSDSAYVYVYAYLKTTHSDDVSGGREIRYTDLGFDLIVIGY